MSHSSSEADRSNAASATAALSGTSQTAAASCAASAAAATVQQSRYRTDISLSNRSSLDQDEIRTKIPRFGSAWSKIHADIQKNGVLNLLRRGRGNISAGRSSPMNLGASLVDGSDAKNNGEMPSKVPSSIMYRIIFTISTAGFFHIAAFAAMTLGMAYGVYANRYKFTDVDFMVDWSIDLNVAFIGNAYLFVNDVPRLMEAISEGHIYSQSVIHPTSGSLANILLTGNGMYQQWHTSEAFLENFTNYYGYNESIYDFGFCTVAQLLMGYDEILSYGNKNKNYYNDGKNPCIMDETYFEYTNAILEDNTTDYSSTWDYVVLVDQTKRMAFKDARKETVYSLANAYGPLLNASGAVPVIVDTHAFWSDNTNMTGLQSVEYFQSLIYDGVEDYVEALAAVLPDWQYPVVAPVGLAYLTVYEERPLLWQKLFINDNIHSSVHGSYLFACVLYATLYGHMPDKKTASKVEYLFADSRKLVGKLEYPSEAESYYYRNVARRVALRGFVPSGLKNLPSTRGS